uniref:Cryptochrome DASH n=1 Tax=Alexandrium monilatum TaxID=311494 RepID=A0A7S4VFR4_9DINO
MAGVVCAWLRNDLRVHDSPVLHRAAELSILRGLPVLPVYCFDPRHFERTRHGTLKTGPVRAQFLLQSVVALKHRLRGLESDLLVQVGRPEDVVPALLPAGSILLTQQEVTSEELKVDDRVRASLLDCVQWEYCWGSTLFHREDLPFRSDLGDMPDAYTRFKNSVEPELACPVNEVPPSFDEAPKPRSRIRVRACLEEPDPGSLPLPPIAADVLRFEPAWHDLPYAPPVEAPPAHEGAVLRFEGGEEAGLERLSYYTRETQLVATYADTRNGLLGADYSTKLAAWLALGCVSPRKVFEQIREHERAHGAGRSTYWLLFAVMARDFFRFFAAKHGDAIFRPGGPLRRRSRWTGGDREFELWAQGRTGFPFVDANMRELRATGFMSNRGRQNVASFLVLDLHVDWRRGADWFESHLVDYDVTANWCNWVFAAGLTGGRINRFNVVRQSKMYDAGAAYLRHWLPELRDVPAELAQEPWLMTEEQRRRYGAEAYPPPCLPPSAFVGGAPKAASPGERPPGAQGRRRGPTAPGKGAELVGRPAGLCQADPQPAGGGGSSGRRWRSGKRAEGGCAGEEANFTKLFA